MRSTLISLLAFGLSALAQSSSFMNPSAGDSWPMGQMQNIMWDSSMLAGGMVDIHLVPSGATDITVIVTEIALQVPNSGSFMWAPDATVTVTDVEIIIVDSMQKMIISEVFIIIIEEVMLKTSTKSTTKKTSTMTTKPMMLSTGMTTKTSTKPITTMTMTMIKTTSMSKMVSSMFWYLTCKADPARPR
jgi:hypothetical protein